MDNYQNWHLGIEAGIARLTLGGAGPRHILNPEVLRELRTLSQAIRENPEVKVVLLSGADRTFCAGVDLRIIRQMVGQEREVFAETLRDLQDCLDAFEAIPQPIVAAIRGFCIGGGMILAACCDFRYADTRTVFSLPEVKRGIGVIMGAARVARLTGMTTAKEWMLLGDRIRPEQARERGFLNTVVAPKRLDEVAMETARKLAALPADAVRLNKRILDEGQLRSLRASQDLEIELQGELLNSPDFRAAIDGFFED